MSLLSGSQMTDESFVSTLQKTDNCFTFFPDALLAVTASKLLK